MREPAENPYEAPRTSGTEPDTESPPPYAGSSPRAILYVQLAAAIGATLAGLSERVPYLWWAMGLALPGMLIALFGPLVLVASLINHRPAATTVLWSLIASFALAVVTFIAMTPLVS